MMEARRLRLFFTRDYWEKEWAALERKERRYILKKQKEEKVSGFRQKIAEKVPDKLENTLNTAFRKAFGLVFEKGTGMIEKTYDKEKHERSFLVNEYAAGLKENRKNVKAFSKQAGASRTKNLLLSGVEGVGLGVLGIGIPDIPLFTAVVLKSIYEIALSYGFAYETEEEQCFILIMIENAFLRGDRLEQADRALNQWMDAGEYGDEIKFDKKEQISRTCDVLAEAILYMKFIQGIPIAGIVGGLADTVYLKKITDYAELKYKRRFLRRRMADTLD